ncbi:MAG: hypothetical protein H6667_23310 [Ardenticatenaceae bacterium]|nr:hypothetical protein [Ardenticatenaceae bacterium]MCB9445603.1 hypothetical protein [Ardenticatenaceae bacterium]
MKLLQYQLELLEPALLTAPGGDPNTDESVDHIPGSVIRGALAHKYRQANMSQADFARLFLDGSTRFFNAYLAHEAERMLPTPAHWQRKKDPQTSDEKEERRVYDLTKQQLSARKSVGGPFMWISNETVYAQRPQHEVAVHNARNREMGRAIPNDTTNRSALFRYRALAARQKFVGYILVKDADAAQMQSLLDGQIWLGGSRSAGYGRSQFTTTQTASTNREIAQPRQVLKAGTPFWVYFTSDAILRDPESGQHGAYLQEQLADLLSGHTLQVLNSYGRFGWVGGFNLHWGLPLPQTWSMLKGSVWQMQSDQDISAADIERIEQRGIGARRAEGFGALLILPMDAWPQQLYTPPYQVSASKQSRSALKFPNLSADSAKMLQQMNERIVIGQLDRQLLAAVNHMNTRGLNRLSNSQVARLQMKAWQEAGKPSEQFKRFRQFIRGTSERKTADDQYRKCRIQGSDFRDWLTTLAGNPETVWELMGLQKIDGKWQRFLLGEKPFEFSTDLAHEYTIRLIAAICDKVAKDRRSK